MRKICFLYINGTHQVYHSILPAIELSRIQREFTVMLIWAGRGIDGRPWSGALNYISQFQLFKTSARTDQGVPGHPE
jgi:hypothetical protein